MEKDKLLNAFYLVDEDFGDNVNSLAMVTEDNLVVFGKDENRNKNEKIRPRIVFKGLNIRGCVQVHQGYLYTISDPILQRPTL